MKTQIKGKIANDNITFNKEAFYRLMQETREEGVEIGFDTAVHAIQYKNKGANDNEMDLYYANWLQENKVRILTEEE